MTDYQPTKDERERLKKFQGFLDAGKQFRAARDPVFEKAEQFMRGAQWETPKPEHLSDYVSNMMLATLESKIAFMTDNNPIFVVYPVSNEQIQANGIQLQITPEMVKPFNILLNEYGWDHWGLGQVVENVGRDAGTMGSGLLKVVYNPKGDLGRGDEEFINLHPKDVFLSPDCEGDIQNCLYILERRVMLLSEIKLKYPDKGELVKADSEKSYSQMSQETDFTSTPSTGRIISNVPGYENKSSSPSGAADYAIEHAVVYEGWYRDPETEELEEPVLDESQQPVLDQLGMPVIQKIVKLKYPQGRHYVWCGDIELLDEPNPRRSGKFPYIKLDWYKFPRSAWGVGEYEMHHRTQRAYNRIFCNLIDDSNGSNNKWVYEKGAVISPSGIEDVAWQTLEVTDIGKFKPMQALPPPPGLYELLGTLRQSYDLESGIHDVSRGNKPEGLDRVGVALTMKESDLTRLRPLIRSFEKFISDVGEMILEDIIQHNRFARIYNYMDSQTGQIMPLQLPAFDENLDIIFKVKVQSNTTLPHDKSSRAAMAIQMFQMGVIGQQALLKAVEFPGAADALKEKNMMNELQQMVQQLQQQLQEKESEANKLETQVRGSKAAETQAKLSAIKAGVGAKVAAIKGGMADAAGGERRIFQTAPGGGEMQTRFSRMEQG